MGQEGAKTRNLVQNCCCGQIMFSVKAVGGGGCPQIALIVRLRTLKVLSLFSVTDGDWK